MMATNQWPTAGVNAIDTPAPRPEQPTTTTTTTRYQPNVVAAAVVRRRTPAKHDGAQLVMPESTVAQYGDGRGAGPGMAAVNAAEVLVGAVYKGYLAHFLSESDEIWQRWGSGQSKLMLRSKS